jgi:hypothetical protein
MSINSGQFFELLLLAITPSAVGAALDGPLLTPGAPANTEQWITFVKDNFNNEDPDVLAEIVERMSNNTKIFDKLLTPVTYLGAPHPVAWVMKELVWGLGIDGTVLSPPWMNPPHPGGSDVTDLFDILDEYEEEN